MTTSASAVPATAADAVRSLLEQRRRLVARLLGLANEAGEGNYVVIFSNGRSVAVDDVLQQDELEVRSLPALLAEMKIYAGAAVVAGEALVLVVTPEQSFTESS